MARIDNMPQVGRARFPTGTAKTRIHTLHLPLQSKEWVETTERQRRESWLLSIEAAKRWAGMEMEYRRLQTLPDVPKQIEAPKEGWEIVEGIAQPVEEPEPPPVEEPPPEEEPVEEKPAMTLGEALGTPINRDASKIGMKSGDYLVKAVKKDCKELFENLSKPSAHSAPTFDNVRIQEAATVILANWDKAREGVMSEEEEEPVEAEVVEVDEGGNPPLF